METQLNSTQLNSTQPEPTRIKPGLALIISLSVFLTFLPVRKSEAIWVDFITTYVYYGYGDVFVELIPVFRLDSSDWAFLYQSVNTGYRPVQPYGTQGGLLRYHKPKMVSNRYVNDKKVGCGSLDAVRAAEARGAIARYINARGLLFTSQIGSYFDVYFSDGHQVFKLISQAATLGVVDITDCIEK